MRDSNGTVHPGRVGIWAGSGSAAVKGDNFKVRSLNADLAVDGRFADDIGSCSISGGAYVMNSSGDTRQSVLSRLRIGGAYVVRCSGHPPQSLPQNRKRGCYTAESRIGDERERTWSMPIRSLRVSSAILVWVDELRASARRTLSTNEGG